MASLTLLSSPILRTSYSIDLFSVYEDRPRLVGTAPLAALTVPRFKEKTRTAFVFSALDNPCTFAYQNPSMD